MIYKKYWDKLYRTLIYLRDFIFLFSLRIINKDLKRKILISDYNYIHKKISHAKQFRKYLKKMKLKKIEPNKSNDIYGFVIIPNEWGDWYQFSINLAVMLYINGYRIKIIVDDLVSIEEEYICKGITNISVQLTKYILREIQKLGIDVDFVSTNGKLELNKKEKDKINKIFDESQTWLYGQSGKYFYYCRENFIENAMYIKNYSEHSDCDIINIYTGLQFHKGVWRFLFEKKGIRCSTYDSEGKVGGKISFVRSGPQGHCLDIPYIMNNNLLENQKIKYIINKYQNIYEDRIVQTNLHYDIFIPLNIMWDAAALDVTCIFENSMGWLLETVEYILNYTNANVIIREHPHTKKLLGYHYVDLYENICKIKGYTKNRVYYSDYNDTINSYEYINGCKLVLPYTSTVGIEAVAMGKKVLCCANSYYCQCGIGELAISKKDYFMKIKEYAENTICPDEKEKEKALIAIELHDKSSAILEYNEIDTNWEKVKIEEMMKNDNIKKIIKVIADGTPFALQNL